MRGLVTCEEGAFEVTPPQTPGGEWTVTQFMDWPISDISAIDIDGDGELEFATIEAFHGEYFRVYKKIDGVLQEGLRAPRSHRVLPRRRRHHAGRHSRCSSAAAGAANSSCSMCAPADHRP
jgi:hypothetical protein